MAHKRNSVEVPELEKLLAGKKKKYVRYEEGAVLYSMGKNSFRQVAQDAHAIVRLKRIALVNVEVLDEYLSNCGFACGHLLHQTQDVEDCRG